MKRYVIAFVLAAILLNAMYYGGGFAALGAHPRWSSGFVWIGIGIGSVLGTLAAYLQSRRFRVASLGAVAAIASYAVASIGKNRFAASFAEDQTAGLMWYAGWIAACAAVTLTLIALALRSNARIKD